MVVTNAMHSQLLFRLLNASTPLKTRSPTLTIDSKVNRLQISRISFIQVENYFLHPQLARNSSTTWTLTAWTTIPTATERPRTCWTTVRRRGIPSEPKVCLPFCRIPASSPANLPPTTWTRTLPATRPEPIRRPAAPPRPLASSATQSPIR